MADHEHWQLDGSAPELYQRYLVPAITTKWAEDLLGRAQPVAGEAVLDVACGTGVVAHLAGKRMAEGRVAGLDLKWGHVGSGPGASERGSSDRMDRGQRA
jgi:trans-aconitate methyltransferase